MNEFDAGDYKGECEIISIPTDNEKLNNQWWNMRIVSRNVKKLRHEKGWSQTEVAIRAGVQAYQVCQLEGDKYYKVTFYTVGLVARALGVSISILTNPD